MAGRNPPKPDDKQQQQQQQQQPNQPNQYRSLSVNMIMLLLSTSSFTRVTQLLKHQLLQGLVDVKHSFHLE
jgi:hypothetical protein